MTDVWRPLLKYDKVRDRGDAPHIESHEGSDQVQAQDSCELGGARLLTPAGRSRGRDPDRIAHLKEPGS
jgi:hypothetical protein